MVGPTASILAAAKLISIFSSPNRFARERVSNFPPSNAPKPTANSRNTTTGEFAGWRREFRRAATDADHSLAFMDFVQTHSPDEEWTMSHEQYRPFVLFHRVQSGSLAEFEERGPEAAIEEINRGLTRFRDLFAQYELLEQFESDELVARLVELKESVRSHYQVGRTLNEKLVRRGGGGAIRASGRASRSTGPPRYGGVVTLRQRQRQDLESKTHSANAANSKRKIRDRR